MPWRATPGATVASGTWLLIAATTVALGMRRIRAAEFASSRRNGHRFAVNAPVLIDGNRAELVDISVGGMQVRLLGDDLLGPGQVHVELPGAAPMDLVTTRAGAVSLDRLVSLQVAPGDWTAMRTLSLWLFHTPPGVLAHMPRGVPAASLIDPTERPSLRRSRAASARVRSTVANTHV